MASGWICPDCGRRFKQRTREHSCDVRSLDSHVGRGSEEVQAAFESLQRVLTKLGPHTMVPVKTMVVLRAGSNFGGLTFGRSFLDVSFFLSGPLDSPRVRGREVISATKIAYRVRISTRRDVDAELTGWLRQAYRECVRSDGPE